MVHRQKDRGVGKVFEGNEKMKMKTKDEIIDYIISGEDTSIKKLEFRIEICTLETFIDIRDLLEEIRGELREANRL